MIQEVYKDIYMFPASLPNNPLREINIFVIKGKDRNVIFDTGFNKPESKQDLIDGLKALGLEVSDVDLVLSHLHSDHTGLASMFSDAGCRVYAGPIDGKLMNAMSTESYWEDVNSTKILYGLAENETQITDHPGYNFKLDRPVDFIPLEPGQMFKVGDYDFEVLDLKGHTPGHIGLYERKHRLLISADTILDPITPNITFWGFEYEDILGTYMDTLRMLEKLDIDIAFPTHRKIITNHKERIDQLIKHHFIRLQEILDAMNHNDEYTVRDISSVISWRIKADGWDNFPKAQKWFATGETMSHMEYLVNRRYLSMRDDNGTLKFTKKKDRILQKVIY